MKSIGIVRRIDELGRVVIPKEVRDNFEIMEKDSLEIFVDGEKIILKKYIPSCIFCGSSKELITYNDKLVCNKCIAKMSEIE